ncbi:MAG TPA: hypothetical protein VF656_18905 [Pyrinomonadaceae bacterium]
MPVEIVTVWKIRGIPEIFIACVYWIEWSPGAIEADYMPQPSAHDWYASARARGEGTSKGEEVTYGPDSQSLPGTSGATAATTCDASG